MSTSIFNKLKVVIWKNVIIRKRHWFLTLCEITIPVLLFVLISFSRAKLEIVGKRYVNESTYNSLWDSSRFYRDSLNGASFLFYTPENEFTNSLIDEVKLKLQLNSAAIKSFTDEISLVAYYEKFASNETVYGIVFKGLSNGQVPKQLDYSIRPYAYSWQTNELFDSSMVYTPEKGSSAYIFNGFIALQMALDTSFVEIVGKFKEFPVDLSMQEFPYPPYLDDMGISDMFSYVFPIVTVFSFIFLCPAVIKRIVEEKRTGIKELMKMMGLKSWMLWVGWFIHAFAVSCLSVLIITFFMKVPLWGANYPAIEYCDASVFAIFLILYVSAGIVFCFAISSLLSNPSIAVVVGILVWQLSYSIPAAVLDKSPNMFWTFKIIFALFPNMALYLGFKAISVYEAREVGSTWSNLFESASGGKHDVTMGNVFIMFLVDIVVYLLIALYFERVTPGPYGLSKPFHFPVSSLINKFRKNVVCKVKNQPELNINSDCKIETANNLKAGIEISHLFKSYNNKIAVNDLSIDIYEGQITALLGHNGAGKTTTMSIITGMIGATSGNITINRVNIRENMDQVYGCLGVCPQNNLQFTDLTVLEHLVFFGMLKGLSKRESVDEAEKLLDRLFMSSKKNFLASKLSGGMRRKLSLGITLMGNSTVLILDEPTSGLDPEARREIWDILLGFRGSRTIVITTHFMEEADILGDRIAIMDHGKLVCYGTSMFLKKEYGTGYHLTLICDSKKFNGAKDVGQKAAIISTIQQIIPIATLESEHGNQLTYLLPHEMKSLFGELLSNLENKKEELAISNINVSVTTLEEVFLKAGNPKSSDTDDTKSTSSSDSNSKRQGKVLLCHQIKSLLCKRGLVTKRKYLLFLNQFVIALLLTFLTLHLGSLDEQSSEDFIEFNMNLAKYDETGVFYNAQGTNSNITKMSQFYNKIVKQQRGIPHLVDSVSGSIIEEGIQNIAYYKQHMIVAAEFNFSSEKVLVNAMYANKALHGAPISLNLVMNSVLKALMGDEYGITTSNNPLPLVDGEYFRDASELQATLMWSILFPLGLLFFTGTFLFFPQMEQATNVKSMQIMCGFKAYWYWISNYVFDLFLYFILLIFIIIFVCIFGSPTYNGAKQISALTAIMVVYGLCIIPYCYLFSYKKTAAGAFASYLISGLFVSIVLVIVTLVLEFSGTEYYENVAKILSYVFSLFPQYGVTYATVRFARRTILNYNWDSTSIHNQQAKCRFDYNPCCDKSKIDECITYQSYFKGERNISMTLMLMICSMVIYFLILVALETRFIKKMWNYIINHMAQLRLKKEKSKDECDSLIINSYTEPSAKNLLKVKNLEKSYGLQKVVNRISFDVDSGDCFGLLGVNGAGKTTTFRMLTGLEISSNGTVEILEANGESKFLELSKDHDKYLQRVGYCPQFDALNEMLTGREMLELFGQLRGLQGQDLTDEVVQWLELLGLKEYENVLCGEYSGGNKRKLSVAIALIGSPRLVMLDEPTSGVDPASRRKLWNVVNLIKEQDSEKKPSIILTSHSMEECEILCNRLTIMKAGKLACTGTIPQLKEDYSQGFTVKLKLKTSILSVVVDTMNDDNASVASQSQPLNPRAAEGLINLPTILSKECNEIEQLKADFQEKYSGFWELCDEHSGLLHYHLKNKNLTWSMLFKDIEGLKQIHSIIEDYHISETTLEEVFLSIAKSDKPNVKSPKLKKEKKQK